MIFKIVFTKLYNYAIKCNNLLLNSYNYLEKKLKLLITLSIIKLHLIIIPISNTKIRIKAP